MSQLNVNTIGARTGTDISVASGNSLLNASGKALSNGLLEFDQWAMTANQDGNGNNILLQNNLARPTGKLQGGYKGNGMTVSSGIWTFPTTGHWYVQMNANVQFSNYASGFIYIYVTANNGTDWTLTSLRQGQGQTNYDKANLVADAFLDITDTSNHKVYFKFYDEGNATLAGDSVESTNFTFIRLGDT